MSWLKASGGQDEQGRFREQGNSNGIRETLTKLLVAESPCVLNASGAIDRKRQSALTRKYAAAACTPRGARAAGIRGRDTEAGMLSGISRKRKIRSNLYWFTEFCNSQCLSHFAAPFIVVRAETSVAESCKQLFQWGSPPDDVTVVPKQKFKGMLGNRSGAGRQSNSTLLPSSFQARASMCKTQSPSSPGPSQEKCTVVRLDACE